MFDRFVRLTQARRALAAGRPEEALRLLSDPMIASERRSEEMRDSALDGLLARSQTRAASGDLRGAIADVEAVLKWRPDHAAAAVALSDLRERAAAAKQESAQARVALQEVRAMIDGGDLGGAEARLAAMVAMRAVPDASAERKSIMARRSTAATLVAQAGDALARGDLYVARDLALQARVIDRQAEGLGPTMDGLGVAIARSVAEAAAADLARGAVTAACERLVRERAMLPGISEQPALQRVQQEAASRLRAMFERDLRAGRLREALAAFAEIDSRVTSAAWLGAFASGMDALRDGLAAADDGDFDRAAERLADAGRVIDAPGIVQARDAAAAEAAAIVRVIDGARSHVARGEVGLARQGIERGLVRWPLARALHAELRLLEEGALERQRRLATARQAAHAGRLREAATQAMALACPGDIGDEARQLQAELQAKLDVVAAGIDQVQRAVHGRSSGSCEGLAHCIARLDELAKVQSDHEHLGRLREALVTERRGLELIRAIVEHCRALTVPQALIDDIRELMALRGGLLAVDRLDARMLEVIDEVCSRAEAEVASGRLRVAQRCIDALGLMSVAFPAATPRADDLRSRVGAAQAAATEAVQRGRAALAVRAVDDAESALDSARRHANDADEVCALERELDALRDRLKELDEVQAMTDTRDFAGAQQRLADLPPTPAALRTKIFDLKRSLARAQGLDGGFLLRVDEGGEFLVLRRDSLSIGNLRDGRADLAVLANIAGQHARVQRRMSFHGGMEERVVADRGEVAVNGLPTREHRLHDGDEVSLAGQLRLSYHVPSARSLTTLLRVLGGFQVRGTDKILLMKDRGRDGRILIGNCKDAHVPIPTAGPEVELFAGVDGQVRVRCAAQGTMDGRPFSGEHPIAAGAVVVCGGIAFVLLPLPPG